MAGREKDGKGEILRRQGTLNPRPEEVKDSLFQGSDFFDPRDLVQVRYEMLRRVTEEDQTVAETTKSFGVSRPCFYKTRESFEQSGLAGLVPRKRGPRGGHKLTAEVMQHIEEALSAGDVGDASALAGLVEARWGLKVHPRSIERALALRKERGPQ